ncbi:electron transfer flavoprotein subunit alpha/FixB family protein [Halobacillus sp. Marseille-Q1614]|uniref:electron transfer flavoprotein subunit alpha/FixB family protein n=1 Tax=Halobacillus sp. Marseille-Q1614 TaxID=2709134 RepID=UPI001570F85D|nr:electron transfer flavoprotein subunit alpha/FixB family protein [Halobacillus sp. Marseille-Q1614]
MDKNLLVVAEMSGGSLRHVSYEAIAAAKEAAGNGEVAAVLIGENVKHLAEYLLHYGADRVLTAEHENLANYSSDGYAQALFKIVEDEQPDGIIMAHTAIGKDLAPRIASRLEAGLVSDVTSIDMQGEKVIFTRPIYSGKAFEKKEITEGLLLATIRPNNIKPLDKDENRTGQVSSVNIEVETLRTTLKEVIRNTSGGIDLSEAKVIVAGGRGVKSEEGFVPLQQLADVLGGTVGASRGACDAGYCDYALQIGQTGKVVTPDLYIACGISGAIQHLAGMSNSKVIVAINKDPEANIFKVADYGIVGDLFDVVPALTEELKQLKVGV